MSPVITSGWREDEKPSSNWSSYSKHPRSFPVNVEPRRRFEAFKKLYPVGIGRPDARADQEIRWCWEEIGSLRALLALLGVDISGDDADAPA